MALGGYGTGMLVESHEGRPTKVEGNPGHPASRGALGTLEQAAILSLYDPTRARELTHAGMPATWRELAQALASPPPPGKRTHVLVEPTSAPHVIDLVEKARRRGDVVVHYDTPLARDSVWAGARLAFGKVLEPRWDFARAEVVVALDSDFLAATGVPMSWARAWATTRAPGVVASGRPGRLYVAEPRLTVTGMTADERLRLQAREVRGVAAAMLSVLMGLPAPAADPHAPWVDRVVHDLRAHAGSGLVVAGDGQPAAVHAFVHGLNEILGNAGRTVTYGASPVHEAGGPTHGLGDLARALDAGEVHLLVIVGGNPVYSAPADLDFATRMRAAHVTAYVGLYENETARASSWFAPEAHFLEAWSDALAFDGTASIAQPLITPLVETKTAGQVLAALVGAPDATSRDLVEDAWRARHPGAAFEPAWGAALVRGFVEGAPAPSVRVAIDWQAVRRELAMAPPRRAPLEIVFYADAKVHDGRFANTTGLPELADRCTKLTWDNAAIVSPATAARLGLESEDVVELEVRGRHLRAPTLVVPGTGDDVVAIALGYGQTGRELIASGVGADAYAIRDSRALWFDDAVARPAGSRWPLAVTQKHSSTEGRPIALRVTLEEFRRDPDFARPLNEAQTSLYQLHPDGAHQWGMTIDLGTCTGCSACVVACMAENNIPVVGKGGVRLGREMHWIRLDRYFVDEGAEVAAIVQPMMCQHCEKAPCEYVCPVNATVHSSDGLNEMIYNRCVGTRFCSNNCPYKVRRFNFFNYNADKPETVRLAMNPDVTVRARGVMEKCTYCVQRIREAEIRARREERPIRDLEILTACQQTCPTGAIVFGDIADPSTHVSATRSDPRLYQVLHELGTLPRTRYLARVVNPSPDRRPA